MTSTGLKSKYAGLIGLDGEKDSKSLKLDRKLTQGSLLALGDEEILITDKMAEFYKVSVGDSVVIPANTPQRITNLSNTEDLEFYCHCSPRFVAEVYENLE